VSDTVLSRFRDGLLKMSAFEIKKLAPDMPLIVISPTQIWLQKVRLPEVGEDD